MTDLSEGQAREARATPLTARLRLPGLNLWGLLVPALALAALEAAVAFGFVPARLMPPPSAILETFRELYDQGLVTHLAVSTARVLAGYALGVALAVPIGAIVGLNRRAESLLDPTFQALRAIPGLAWVPLLLLWLGIDEGPKVTLIAIGSFFPVYLGLIAGIRNVDRKLVEVGEMYGLGPVALVRRIFLPAALPSLFTGLRQGLSLAWMCLVAAELIAATQGIGYLLTDGREVSRPDIVIAAILMLALLGKLSDTLLKRLERRALHWRDSFETRLG
ncbi:ABC transporter permease [Ancylobacter sp.]|uniref:ABC transporter permease n=1 Tax=Ancylobacter sp. TaxID=1872567 RepID=UPI003BA8E914